MRAIECLGRFGLTTLILTSSSLLLAQDADYAAGFNVRTSYAPSPKDNLRYATYGLGVDVTRKLGKGRIGLELGYTYTTGDDYYPKADTSRVASGLNPADPAKSGEDKRNEFSGVTLRAFYTLPLNQDWAVKGGLQFGGSFTHQYVGTTRSTAYPGKPGDAVPATAWADTYYGKTRKSAATCPSIFAGVSYALAGNSRLELNLLLLNYKAVEYQHVAGTAAYSSASRNLAGTDISAFPADSIKTQNRMVPQLELTYGFQF